MFELKKLARDSIDSAIKTAEQYRLLGEPRQTESICLDVLEIEPSHQRALILLLLARTDQFSRQVGSRIEHARELLPRIEGEYEQAYYAGLICERWGKAQLRKGHPGSGRVTYGWLREAMELYERAERHRRPGNDDPVLRWNACARLITQHEHVEPVPDDDFHPLLE